MTMKFFGAWAETAYENGYSPIPMAGKRPRARNWSRGFGANAIRKLCASMPDANLGILLGNIVAIDIDIEDPNEAHRVAELAMEILGPTPYVRVGRWPRRMLFYRATSRINTRSIHSVDILGSGSAVLLGVHPDTDNEYYWPDEGLVDANIDDVPLVSPEAMSHFSAALQKRAGSGSPSAARAGPAKKTKATTPSPSASPHSRNKALFDELRKRAVACGSIVALRAHALQLNGTFNVPMTVTEVEGIVQSVWGYKTKGTLWVPGTQNVVLPIGAEHIRRFAAKPDAMVLLSLLHATRTKREFEIPQKATAKYLHWGSDRRVKKAIDFLISEGLLRELRRARGSGKAVRVFYGW
nr:hypothetical protein RKHAN_03336 [Rhizobium sp. Khangiran2]